jgi:hypothetical protein
VGKFRLEFYEDEHGDQPVLRWLREELSRTQRLVVGTAMREVLEEEGIDVCGTTFGRQLGKGLFEFRIGGNVDEFVGRSGAEPAEEKILVRVFCHAHGSKLILLLAGYDKLAQSSKSHQNAQIELARKRLRAWKLAQAKKAKPPPSRSS